MIDHHVAKIGESTGEHWAISAQVVAITSVEKGELNIYNSKQIAKTEETLSARSTAKTLETLNSAKSSNSSNNGRKGGNMENGSPNDNVSTASESEGKMLSQCVIKGPGRQNPKQSKRGPHNSRAR